MPPDHAPDDVVTGRCESTIPRARHTETSRRRDTADNTVCALVILLLVVSVPLVTAPVAAVLIVLCLAVFGEWSFGVRYRRYGYSSCH